MRRRGPFIKRNQWRSADFPSVIRVTWVLAPIVPGNIPLREPSELFAGPSRKCAKLGHFQPQS
jgi:hypothetical protein